MAIAALAANDRIPLPIDQVMSRLALSANDRSPAAIMSEVAVENWLIEDYRPMSESIEWRIGAAYWNATGVRPFAEHDVPFIINNTGRLSANAAVLLFEHLETADPGGPLAVLEVGAGTGLFACYFMKTFRALCEQQHRDYFERTLFFVTDRSPATVADWRDRGVFTGLDGHIVTGVYDSTGFEGFSCLTGDMPRLPLSDLIAVYCNYVLDSLPAALVRADDSSFSELHVRTTLGAATVNHGASLAGIRKTLDCGREGALADLAPHLASFEFETDFRPATAPVAALAAELAHFAAGATTFVVNHGAIALLRALAAVLRPEAMVLINDYGSTEAVRDPQLSIGQRFGPTSAVGLNFALLGHALAADGWTVLVPTGDAEASIHARLLLRGSEPRTAAAFENRFSAFACDHFESPMTEARAHIQAGRSEQALQAYRIAVERSPDNWAILGEAAEFVGLHLHDYQSGLLLARAAVELNPWYSTWLWNVLGDCLYCMSQFTEAHEAYLQAARINPGDVRTNLDLAHTWAQQGDLESALIAVARGLADDRTGMYRQRLLERQQHILQQAEARQLATAEALARRSARFGPQTPVALAAVREPPAPI